MKRKVLHVTSCFQYGGTEAYVMNNFRAIDRDRFQFDFYFFAEPASPYAEEIAALGGRIYPGSSPAAIRIIPFISDLVRHIRVNGPYDAVHSHVNAANSWVMVAAFIACVEVRISHCHNTSSGDPQSLLKMAYRRIQAHVVRRFSTRTLACSRDAGDHLYGAKYFSRHGEVVHNGIDVRRFMDVSADDVAELRRAFDIPTSHSVVGNITRFDSQKNPEFTVEVFREVLAVEPDSILILGGVDAGKLPAIKVRVRELQIEDHVRFIGVRSDVHLWLHLMDAYLFPSLFEGLGIALLEAQAAGLPCFASTRVPRDVDMGLGLVHFLDLDDGATNWSRYILDNCPSSTAVTADTQAAFDARGYSIGSSVKRLERIYDGE